MILSIIKKVTVIYLLRNSLLFLLIICSHAVFSADDLTTFCFEKNVQVKNVEKELAFLLLPKEKIFLRPQDSCVDILTSTDRVFLLEKFLSKRYNLVKDVELSRVDSALEHCRLELKETKTLVLEKDEISLGHKNNQLKKSVENQVQTNTSEILLGLGKPGSLGVGNAGLFVRCSGGHNGFFQLAFSLTEDFNTRVNTEITIKKNEIINVGEIKRDLDEKNKTVGIPQTSLQSSSGESLTKYELQIK